MPKTNTTSDYTSEIIESMKPLSGKEKVRYRDLTASKKLDEEVSEDASLVVMLANYIKIKVHNSKADNPDYNVMIVVDKDNNSYYTSSETFMRALEGVVKDMEGETEEWGIEVVKKPSSNYKGKFFLTCTVY